MIGRYGIVEQGLRYAVAGGLAAAVDLGLFVLLFPRYIPHLWIGAAISFTVAAAVNYTASSLFVFGTETLSLRRWVYFLIGASFGLLINVGITAAVAAGTDAHPAVAKCGGIGTAFLFNFLVNRYVVFGLPRAPALADHSNPTP